MNSRARKMEPRSEKHDTVSNIYDQVHYRICPSKLTKRELEDLYFNLLDTNLNLNNALKEKEQKIKALTTKMHRLYSAQKVHEANERKDCFAGAKNTLNQNKTSITDLRRTNERMAERIRLLHIKLAAVSRQSGKTAPHARCLTNFKMSPKCSRCDVETKNAKTVVTQTDPITNKNIKVATTETEPIINKDQVCDENKCRTLMEEFKQKIANLEEGLASTHNEYSMRIDRLEQGVKQFNENGRKDIVVMTDEKLGEGCKDDSELAELKVSTSEAQLIADMVPKILFKRFETHVNRSEKQHVCETMPSVEEQEPSKNIKRSVNDGKIEIANNADNLNISDVFNDNNDPSDKELVKVFDGTKHEETSGTIKNTVAHNYRNCEYDRGYKRLSNANTNIKSDETNRFESTFNENTVCLDVPIDTRTKNNEASDVFKCNEELGTSKDKATTDSVNVNRYENTPEGNNFEKVSDDTNYKGVFHTNKHNETIIVADDYKLTSSSTSETLQSTHTQNAHDDECKSMHHNNRRQSYSINERLLYSSGCKDYNTDEASRYKQEHVNYSQKDLFDYLKRGYASTCIKDSYIHQTNTNKHEIKCDECGQKKAPDGHSCEKTLDKTSHTALSANRYDIEFDDEPDICQVDAKNVIDSTAQSVAVPDDRQIIAYKEHGSIFKEDLQDYYDKEEIVDDIKKQDKPLQINDENFTKQCVKIKKIPCRNDKFEGLLDVVEVGASIHEDSVDCVRNILSEFDNYRDSGMKIPVIDKLQNTFADIYKSDNVGIQNNNIGNTNRQADQANCEMHEVNSSDKSQGRLNTSIVDSKSDQNAKNHVRRLETLADANNKGLPGVETVPNVLDIENIDDTDSKLRILHDCKIDTVVLVKSPSMINDEQIKTIELERQLSTKKAIQLEEDATIAKLDQRREECLITAKDDDKDASTSRQPLQNSMDCNEKSELPDIQPKTKESKPATPKHDQHNSLQIPGPVPISTKRLFRNEKVNRETKEIDKKPKILNPVIKNNREKIKKRKLLSSNDIGTIGAFNLKIKTEELVFKGTDDDSKTSNVLPSVDADLPIVDHSGPNRTQSVTTVEKETQVEKQSKSTNDELRIPSSHVVTTHENEYGFLCFKTPPTSDRFICCPCLKKIVCGKRKNREVQAEKQTEMVTKTEQGAVIDKRNKLKSPSVESTEQKLNSDAMPVSKETTTAPLLLSSGSTSTQTEQIVAVTSLNSANTAKVLTSAAVSTTDINTKDNKPTKEARKTGPTLQKVEETLQALTDELARCKELLLRQQSREERNILKENQHNVDRNLLETRPALALRPGQAKHAIIENSAPRCVFTLHIGTVVLSDEAVLNSNDKSLVLRWKFYDQNVSMTRITARRVMLFDFSTEYDITITDEFLHYMKRKELSIVICELNHHEEVFASCSLPLRDAMLHTNRRVDMSLALVTGRRRIDARANQYSDTLDARDEMGVIDLWCMLRVDSKVVPLINDAIAKKKINGSSLSMNQISDSDNIEHHRQRQNKKYKHFTRFGSWDSGQSKDVDARPRVLQNDYFNHQNNYMSHLTLPTTVPIDSGIPFTRKKEPESQDGIYVNEVIANIRTPEDLKHAMQQTNKNNPFCVSKLPGPEDDIISQARSSLVSFNVKRDKRDKKHGRKSGTKPHDQTAGFSKRQESDTLFPPVMLPDETSGRSSIHKRYDNVSKLYGTRDLAKRQVTIYPHDHYKRIEVPHGSQKDKSISSKEDSKSEGSLGADDLQITILWLALNEECEVMLNPKIQRVYVAYSFLGKSGADLETPVSLPKPKHHEDKCYFNFKKTFRIESEDLPLLGHMVRCRAHSKIPKDFKDCIVFTVISEPTEDPLGLETCEDIGYAYLYLGDLLAYSADSPMYTEVIPVTAIGSSSICGVLAIRVDGLDVLRQCFEMSAREHVPSINNF